MNWAMDRFFIALKGKRALPPSEAAGLEGVPRGASAANGGQ
jgi:hypothetical protein